MMPQHFGVSSPNFRIAHGVKMPKDILPLFWPPRRRGIRQRKTQDPDQLRQFVRQFPDSLQRDDAEARLASLLAAQTAWNSVKDSKDPDKLRQFVLQFPDSSERPVAEQRIASLVATLQSQTVVSPPDPHALTRSLQVELQRVGCFLAPSTASSMMQAKPPSIDSSSSLPSACPMTCHPMQSMPCTESNGVFAR
jgi:hypothetical protein